MADTLNGMFDVRDFRVLEEVLSTGSLSGAARALGMSQPAVSQAFAALERRVGAPLLVRTSSGVRLTEAGRAAAGHIRPVLESIRRAEVEVTTVVGLARGSVRIACFPSAAATILPAALRSLRESQPGLTFSVVDLEPPAALTRLADEECDLAVVFDYPDDPAGPASAPGERVVLMEERLHAAVPAGHRLAGASSVQLSDLAGEYWIAGCPQCRSHLLRLCESTGFVPDITVQTDDHLVIARSVAARIGVALVPEVVLPIITGDEVVGVPIEPVATRTISAIRSPRAASSQAVEATLAALRQAAGDFAGHRSATVHHSATPNVEQNEDSVAQS
ncbi:LysR family transcriptional regulator [Kineosporia rhizophila]|uniref:LysR family transcriptional regulator n=1 Tax=Kineosporia TaxID=49184 RepID=UPI001E4DD561|nr:MULTISPECIES: LysR family transcriptional regulator [Kineosporia]MCE0540793.1 LysR family transcriptional regulator [Kineosporia rhizophila]GLY15101.1 LysR family transcriptional regulator [Kineosporia sp. NBRC 101677]